MKSLTVYVDPIDRFLGRFGVRVTAYGGTMDWSNHEAYLKTWDTLQTVQLDSRR